jgi:predicted signal transduction protein with EAL and GGDEF domain/FixJ family two-component response regulator
MGQSENLRLVLVIDDDHTAHLWAKRYLSTAGFVLISALNGYEGVAKFKQHSPDIVLVDIDMPEMDGFATCAAIRQLPDGKNTPLLMVTGTEEAERVASSYHAGATDFVVKPVNWKVLIHRLHYMIKANSLVKQLEKSETRLSKAQQMAKLGSWELYFDDKMYWSEEVFNIFQVDKASFVPNWANFHAMIYDEDKVMIQESFDYVRKSRTVRMIEYRIVTAEGQQRFVGQQIEGIENAKHELIGLTGTIQDITERKNYENKIKHLAYHDEITGLPNRTFFLELLSTSIKLAERSNRHFAVLFLDMDDFKGINDSYGHNIGNFLLKEVSKRLIEVLNRTDIACRYFEHHDYHQGHDVDIARLGGDEFTIILNKLNHSEDAAIVAENIQKWISKPMVLENQLIYTSSSVGIAIYPQDGDDSESLLRNADIAMYHAKKLGKGHCQFFHDSMNIKARQRRKMETCMFHAVENNELRLYYQPIVGAKTGQVVGVEALMRWDNPQLGFLPPDDFIPLAEDNGLIVKFGEWAIREVCRQHIEWQQQGMGHLSIAVNLSSLQFNQPNFLTMVADILRDYQIVKPRFLIFELTESVIMSDTVRMFDKLWGLKHLGIKLSVDDFGTGYSSLSYLKSFPLDSLKIDRSFIKELPHNENDAAIVNAVLALAHTLNLSTVAEGVENLQQRKFLERSSCNSIQGYLFSKPMPVAEFNRYWQTNGDG